MAALRVIFIHGTADVTLDTDFAEILQMSLLNRLRDWCVIQPEWSAEEVSRVITFDTVNFAPIGQAQEELVRKSTEEDMKHLFGPIDRLLGKLALDQVRRQIIGAFSDVLLYQSACWREKLREQVLKTLQPYVENGDAVTIVGHGVGSVVAFDVVYYHSRHNPTWQAAGFKPSNLFTLGSPLALFSMELDNRDGQPKPRYLPKQSTPPHLDPQNTNPDLQPILNEGVWYNFLDAQDIVAYPLAALFKDKFPVEDIVVQVATDPHKAHAGYWANGEVADRIAQCLKFDYERIRRSEENERK